jgi:hypothetical protein
MTLLNHTEASASPQDLARANEFVVARTQSICVHEASRENTCGGNYSLVSGSIANALFGKKIRRM